MKRRMAKTLGAFAAAAALALAVPNSAYAAEGVLIINGSAYVNPSGCYPVDWFPSSVTNHTDAVAVILTGPDCTGEVDAAVFPGETQYTELGNSVFIP